MKEFRTEKRKRNELPVFLIITAILTVTLFSSVKIQAAQEPSFEKEISLLYYKNHFSPGILYIQNCTPNGEILNLYNSAPDVVDVGATRYEGKRGITFAPKKIGKAKITFLYEGKNFTSTVTVRKWTNPCKTFKIGNLNLMSYFKASGWYYDRNMKRNIRGKIMIQPKSGWKLMKIENNGKTVKNKSMISLKATKKEAYLKVSLKNKKTKEVRVLLLFYSDQNGSSGNNYQSIVR